jgi:2-polyprenyl-3-methyl-5-hydroxy-6-metoxy-1,4-benzoquinol methylase
VGLAYLIAQTAPFPAVAFLLLKYVKQEKADTQEPEYGNFIQGAIVSAINLALHTGRYRFAARYAPGSKVLDIGCGTGYGSAYLSKMGTGGVVGGDISEDAVTLARQHHSENDSLSFRTLDAAALPFPDGLFGLVTAFEVIEHVQNYENVVAEAYRVLKQGGVLVLSTPNRQAGPYIFSTSWDHHIHEFSQDELVKLVNRYFGQCEVFGQDHISGRELVVRRLRQTGGRALEKLRLRGLEMWLAKVLFRPNRLVDFHMSDFNREDLKSGELSQSVPGKTPTTLVIVARKG